MAGGRSDPARLAERSGSAAGLQAGVNRAGTGQRIDRAGRPGVARITVVEDADQLAEVGARRVTALLDEAFTRQPTTSLVLTGGHTPERLYERLAAERIDWARVHVFWGDERQVPPDHPDSNYGMAY